MTQTIEQKIKKVAVGFAFLQSGLISTMSDEEFDKFLRWLDA
jgi:hypothetical protein